MNAKKQPFRIEPFKHRVEMDPQYAEKTWKILEDAIREIHNHNASGLSFEELYRNAYNMVLHKYGDRLYNGLVQTITQHLQTIAGIIEAAQMFLEELNRRWLDHNKSMQMIRDILMYMDRTYVMQHQKTNVHELGLRLWKSEVVRQPRIQERLHNTLLQLVQQERLGEIIDRGLMRSITSMLMDLGQDVYQDDFERPFIRASHEYYRRESQEYVSTCDCSDYLKRAERRLNEEMDRVTHYLDSSSEPRIAAVVETEMIQKHVRTLVDMPNSGIVSMLKDEKYDDLARMYMLFRRVPGGLQTIREVMSAYVRETGKELVMDPERQKDPVDYVQRLLNEKDKCDRVIQTSFNNDKSFQNAINQAFEHFINLNSRSPEFISLFIDDRLRRGIKGVNEEDVEVILDKVMMLFRYLQEKDVFEKYYKQHLAKRLLSARTMSDDAERSLILKLKTECGYQFTSKLEGMFTDMKTSKDTMQAFRQDLARDPINAQGIDLSVHVLTTGSWPTQPGAKCNLPPELLPVCNRFRDYYLKAHTGRRLTWQTNMGSADLRMIISETRKHDLNVSTYQMCILMLYNRTDRLTYKEIEQATDIPTVDLKRNLQSLACIKGKNILKKVPMSRDVSDDDEFYFNDHFQSKLVRIKIGTVAAQRETEPEKQETRVKVEEDRKPQIDAAIVRIMKARRVLDYNNIISEVTKQLQSRFLAHPGVIKKRIESLMEREFLERDKVDRRLYRYLA